MKRFDVSVIVVGWRGDDEIWSNLSIIDVWLLWLLKAKLIGKFNLKLREEFEFTFDESNKNLSSSFRLQREMRCLCFTRKSRAAFDYRNQKLIFFCFKHSLHSLIKLPLEMQRNHSKLNWRKYSSNVSNSRSAIMQWIEWNDIKWIILFNEKEEFSSTWYFDLKNFH